MALRSQDIPITREVVYSWLTEYDQLTIATPLEPFLASKLNELQLSDTMVDTREHGSLGDETSLLTLILDDLPSYGYQV